MKSKKHKPSGDAVFSAAGIPSIPTRQSEAQLPDLVVAMSATFLYGGPDGYPTYSSPQPELNYASSRRN